MYIETLLMAQKESRTLLSVHPEEVRGLYGFLASQDMTDDDVFMLAYAPVEDFCTTAPSQDHLPVRDLLYSPLGRWLQRKLRCLRFDEDSGGFLLSRNVLSRVLETLQVFSSSSLVLIPMSILLFGGLDKRAMFGVVVSAVFVFCCVVVVGRGSGRSESGGAGHGSGLLLGVVAAYAAVLTAFIAQLGS